MKYSFSQYSTNTGRRWRFNHLQNQLPEMLDLTVVANMILTLKA